MKTTLRFCVLLLATLLSAAALRAQNYATPYTITTHAGFPAAAHLDGIGTNARFDFPDAIASDGAGNLYVVDATNCVIRKVTAAGLVTTLAGSPGLAGTVDGTGSAARFTYPRGIASDATGNLYVADTNAGTIRKITPEGVVTTLAGQAGDNSEVDGTGTTARFNFPWGITATSTHVYVADYYGQTIRKLTLATGVVTTLAGQANTQGSADGTGSAARFRNPTGVVVDGSGSLFVTDYSNHTVRKVTAAGAVTTFAGTAGVNGGIDGTGPAATLYYPEGLAINGAGTLWVACGGTIRQITSTAVVTTLAGKNQYGGHEDGTGADARFRDACSVALDSFNNAFVADCLGNTIRKVTPLGVVTTFAGTATNSGTADGTGAVAKFSLPQGIAVDSAGNAYVTDNANNTVRKITPDGAVTTLVPNTAGLYSPTGIAVDLAGNVYVASRYNTIYKVTPSGTFSYFSGSTFGETGAVDGPANTARFNSPMGLAVDQSGNVFVADQGNHAIRKITPAGTVTTYAGLLSNPGYINGIGSAARFDNPTGVAIDDMGQLYVAEYTNKTIRKITFGASVTTLAGQAGVGGFDDGTGTAARFTAPWGIAVDRYKNVYVAGYLSQNIRKISPIGIVTTLAGHAGSYGATDGVGDAAGFNWPQGIAVDASGAIYVADTYNNTIRKGTPPVGAVASFYFSESPVTVGEEVLVDGNNSSAYNPGAGIYQYHWEFGDGAEDYGWYALHTYSAPGTYTVRLTIIDNQGMTATVTHDLLVLPLGGVRSDYNGDGMSDLIWTNNTTGERAMWLMNGGTVSTGASLGTVPTAWKIVGTGDFDGNGKTDVLLFNTSTGDRAMWLMNGPTIISNIYLGNISTAWAISAVGDFNGDGKADIFWSNSLTGDRSMWLMDGGTVTTGAYLGVVPVEWKVNGTGDFNGDGKSDIVWTNTTTGDRSMWLMNGSTLLAGASLGNVPVAWKFSRVGDFDGDGKADIVLSNTSTGDRAMWLMNGPTVSSNLYLGNVPVEWTIGAVGDFNGDGKADIFWGNTVTGDRSMWLMNGGILTAGYYLGSVPVEWVNPP